MTADERTAPIDYWEYRTRQIVYMMKHEVSVLYQSASATPDTAKQKIALAEKLNDHAEDLMDYLNTSLLSRRPWRADG